MSGTSTEAGSFTAATLEQLQAEGVLFLAVQPAAGAVPAIGFTATASQIAALAVGPGNIIVTQAQSTLTDQMGNPILAD